MEFDISKLKHKQVDSDRPESSLWKLLSTDIKIGKKKLNDSRKRDLYAELHLLISSGLDLKHSIELLMEQEKAGTMKQNLLEKILTSLNAGMSLSDALENLQGFNKYETQSIRIGEESGLLPEILHEIAEYYERRLQLKRQLTGVLAYPIFVSFVSVGVVYFMLNFVVPLFQDVFKRFDSELPLLTRFVINSSEFIQRIAPWTVLSVLIIALLFVRFRKHAGFRRITSSVVIKLPLIGQTLQMIYLSRFAQAMAVLLRSKTPLVSSLELVKDMVGFYPLEMACEKMVSDVSIGSSLHDSMQRTGKFPKRFVSLIKVAEEVNELDSMFVRLYKDYSREIEHRSQTLGKLLEPVLIVVLGIAVGVILIAMYLPLFEMTKVIG